MEDALSTYQAARVAGASYRQADYWARIGLAVPTVKACGSGSARRYSSVDVRRLGVVARLRTLGLEVAAIREVLLRADEEMLWLADDLEVALGPGGLEVRPVVAAAA